MNAGVLKIHLKWICTHLLALGLGALLVIFWPEPKDAKDCANGPGSNRAMSHRGAGPRANGRPSHSSIGGRVDLMRGLEKEIQASDLTAWIEGKSGNRKSHAEALVIAGMLTNNPDWVRQGIEADPGNVQLLSMGANFRGLSAEERLELSKRLIEADPDNSFGVYMTAALMANAGDPDAAVEVLRGATGRPELEDYRVAALLMTDEALVAAGLSPEAAKLKATWGYALGYLGDFRTMVEALKENEAGLSPEQSAELRTMTATLGQRIGEFSKSGSITEQLAGMSLEDKTLKGLPDDAFSPYAGMTVAEARQSIADQKREVKQLLESYGTASVLLESDPQLMSRYIDRCRLMGELEAMKWLVEQPEVNGR